MKQFLRLMNLFVYLLAGGGCCNFSTLQGNGSGTRAEWAAYLPVATPRQMEQIRVDAEASDVVLLFERGAYAGYKTKLSRGFAWEVPVGPYRERSYWSANSKYGGRNLCIQMNSWGTTMLPFLTGLFMAGNVEIYDYPRGDCLAYQRFLRGGIVPLVAYESSLMPRTEEQQMPGCPNLMSSSSLCRIMTTLEGVKQDQMGECYLWPVSSLNQVQYDRLTSYYFLCGLVAFGQKNERTYIQLAWIPVSLWSLD